MIGAATITVISPERARSLLGPRERGNERTDLSGGSRTRVPDRRTDNEALLPRVAAGDQEAVRQFIARYSNLIWSLALRMCLNKSDCEEAVQEIFVELWEKADRFDSSLGAEATFVSMITRRRLIDRQRRSSRRDRAFGLIEDLDFAGGAESRGESLASSDEVNLAKAAMEDLREEQREVLNMAICRGMTHEQIASTLDMPLGTVKTHARRGLIALRDRLAELGVTGVKGGAA